MIVYDSSVLPGDGGRVTRHLHLPLVSSTILMDLGHHNE